MVRAMMSELHLRSACAAREAEQLMSETNAEDRDAHVQQLANRANRVVTGLGIARPVGKKHAVRFERQSIFRARLRRQHSQFASASRELAQDVALYAVVERYDTMTRLAALPVTLAERPFRL